MTKRLEDSCVYIPDDKLSQSFQESLNAIKGSEPKVFVTTSRTSCQKVLEFVKDLAFVFPNSTFIKNGILSSLSEVEAQVAPDYTHLIVVFEDKKAPQQLAIKLRGSCTYFFRVCDFVPCKSIHRHGKVNPEMYPELIMNNFSTHNAEKLGLLLSSLFPPRPQFRARQVVTFHNQRDFIFFRCHRYIFDDGGCKAHLQELGPRMTLRLFAVSDGWCLSKSFWNYDKQRRSFLKRIKHEASTSQDNKVFFF